MDGLSDEIVRRHGEASVVSPLRQDDGLLRYGCLAGQWDNPHFPWAYTEGLTVAEATNELTLLATGIYGHELPKQHGAPIRLVVPWKYGFKGIKSIVEIEFVDQQPATFWNTFAPHEYGFQSNVNPEVRHPRWSQAKERFISDSPFLVDDKPTLLYNGYGEYVAHLYS